ncbi:MAG: hypothetical protein ACLFVR_12775 [Thiohalospira sp.]
MPNSYLNIIFHLPFEKNDLNEKDKLWLLNFQTILKTSLDQVIQQKINIYNPFVDSAELENHRLDTQNNAVFIQLILNKNYKKERLIQYQNSKSNNKIFQLNCCPLDNFLNTKFKIHSINFFDEKNEEKIDLSTGIESIKDESLWLKITDLSYDIKEYFYDTISTKQHKTTVYFAQVNSDLNREREAIIREFKHLGYQILPENNFPSELDDYEKFVKENIEKSNISVHLIGNTYNPVINGTNKSVVEIQNDLFNQILNKSKKKDIHRLVWIPQNFKPDSEKQRLYAEKF